eukprot:267459-Chlamydomonas_euryale.AAC.3
MSAAARPCKDGTNVVPRPGNAGSRITMCNCSRRVASAPDVGVTIHTATYVWPAPGWHSA